MAIHSSGVNGGHRRNCMGWPPHKLASNGYDFECTDIFVLISALYTVGAYSLKIAVGSEIRPDKEVDKLIESLSK
jgi:hypothetical protein